MIGKIIALVLRAVYDRAYKEGYEDAAHLSAEEIDEIASNPRWVFFRTEHEGYCAGIRDRLVANISATHAELTRMQSLLAQDGESTNGQGIS